MGEKWKTTITKVEPNKIIIRGYSIHKLMGKITFAEAIYLVFKGKLPSYNEGKMIDAILVSSIDHGVTPPSTITSRTVASTGAPLNTALAAGILAISRFHGGAIEEGMQFFFEVKRLVDSEKILLEDAIRKVYKELKTKGQRLSGLGHTLHTQDPRTLKLFNLAKKYDIIGEYVKIAKVTEKLTKSIIGTKLPLNVNGAVAAILCDMGFEPKLGNAFFLIARTPGLIAHIYEEISYKKPLRKINPDDAIYDGPKEKKL